jgi:hypothetical protein
VGLQPDAPSAFPMTVKQFLAESHHHLKRGDIVLSRSKTIVSRLICWATDSYFSHSALVFLVPRMEDGFSNTFVLEADTRGVGLANLRDYISGRNPISEIAILRLEGKVLTDSYFKQVRGIMLDHIKAGYDYQKVWFQFLEFVFGLKLAGSKLRLGGRKSMRDATAIHLLRFHPVRINRSGTARRNFSRRCDHQGWPDRQRPPWPARDNA